MAAINQRFAGKRVVVTGAAGVFGSWIAQAFAREGAAVCLSDQRSDAAGKVAAALPGTGHIVHQTELTDAASVAALGDLVAKTWGAADVVVNNAGVYPKGGLLDLPVAEWDRIFGVNLRGPFLVTQTLANQMIAHGKTGSIVFISSGAARQMRNGTVPYFQNCA
jgi:3-oxoacyl-[acyl-carrier protein] reductase